jgi:hypothetical protein
MVQFEDFFNISKRCLKFIGIEIAEKQSAALRCYFIFNALTMITVVVIIGIFIVQHFDNLAVSGPSLANISVTFLITLKTLHLWVSRHEIYDVMARMKAVFDATSFSDNYERNLMKNNKIQMVFISATFSECIFMLI